MVKWVLTFPIIAFTITVIFFCGSVCRVCVTLAYDIRLKIILPLPKTSYFEGNLYITTCCLFKFLKVAWLFTLGLEEGTSWITFFFPLNHFPFSLSSSTREILFSLCLLISLYFYTTCLPMYLVDQFQTVSSGFFQLRLYFNSQCTAVFGFVSSRLRCKIIWFNWT